MEGDPGGPRGGSGHLGGQILFGVSYRASFLRLNKNPLVAQGRRGLRGTTLLASPDCWKSRSIRANGRIPAVAQAISSRSPLQSAQFGRQASSVLSVLLGHHVGLTPLSPGSLSDDLLLLL